MIRDVTVRMLDAGARDQVGDRDQRCQPRQREPWVPADPEPEFPGARVEHVVRTVRPGLHQVGAVTARASGARLTNFGRHQGGQLLQGRARALLERDHFDRRVHDDRRSSTPRRFDRRYFLERDPPHGGVLARA